MLKPLVTPQDVCDLLNELLQIDYWCVYNLVESHAICNSAVANHPSIQARKYPLERDATLGVIGFLNGLFGVDEKGYSCIIMELEEDKIISFQVSPELPRITCH